MPSRQGGATLVEVLVAVALLSVALYALVAAHAAALRYSQMSRYRATALFLAADMGERLRANLGRMASEPAGEGGSEAAPMPATGFRAGHYDYAQAFQRQQLAVIEPADACTAGAGACTAAQIAAVDLAQWRQAVRRLLPTGAVYTRRDAARAVMDLWVAWRESSSSAVQGSQELPGPPGACPEGLGADLGVRCVHLRIGL
ncbi:prepilin-type N-terminal cleavage/methylation domain-containing protein [Hylemonella sp. W303a]|uniref:type IV pilus modification PilV family protein n=1 Tax=Hylemonella sp. W303a TaxID=3389873 RepID=UPI00396B0C59